MSHQGKPTVGEENEASLLAELKANDKQAHIFDRQGRHTEAAAILRKNLETRQNIFNLSRDDHDILTNKNNLAAQLKNQHFYAEAEALHREVLAADTRIYGLEHPDTISDLNNLAEVFSHSGRYDEAVAMQKQALGLGEKLWATNGLDYLLIEENMANTLARKGDFIDAETIMRKVMQGYKAIDDGTGPAIVEEEDEDGQRHPEGNYLRAMNNLASILGRMGKSNEAVTMFTSLIEQEHDPLGKAIALGNLAMEFKRLERFHEAEVAMSESLKYMISCVDQEDWRVKAGLEDLKYVLRQQEKNEEADKVSIESLTAGSDPKL